MSEERGNLAVDTEQLVEGGEAGATPHFDAPGLRPAPTPALPSVPWILLDGIARTITRAHGLLVLPYEAWDTDAAELLAATQRLVDDALTAARLSLAGYEDAVLGAPANETALDDLAASRPAPPPPCPPDAPLPWKVPAVAFVAALELREQQQRLAALTLPEAGFEIIDACDGARRAVGKSLGALARAIREAEGLPADLGPRQVALSRSLRTRRVYARFHADIVRDGAASRASARIRLRCGVAGIARLIDELGPLVRPSDRRALEDVRGRGLVCLRADPLSEAGGQVAAANLCAALDRVADAMLDGVNRREELVEHDRRAAARASRALAGGDLATVARVMRTTLGRAPAVDGLLRVADIATVDAWELAVTRLRAGLDPSAA